MRQHQQQIKNKKAKNLSPNSVLHALVRQLNPRYTIDTGVEEILLQLTEDFVHHVVQQASKLAHSRADGITPIVLESLDVETIVEKQYGISGRVQVNASSNNTPAKKKKNSVIKECKSIPFHVFYTNSCILS